MSFNIESGRLGLPGILLHGGAGAFAALSDEKEAELLLDGMRVASDAGWAVLDRGGPALDAVVAAVASLEDSGRFNAGRGAVPTTDGTFEFDAAVMDGATGIFGGLCAVTYPANPIRAARVLAELGGVPDGPVLLAGAGADRFCREQELTEMRPEWLRQRTGSPPASSDQGTVGAVAVDSTGQVAAATSTGGRAGQRPGRVGDSPVPGAGVLAEQSSVAVSATGAGEAFLVSGFSHRVAWAMRDGLEIVEALRAALEAVAARAGSGGGIAITPAGEFAISFSTRAMARSWRGASDYEARIARS